MSKLFTDKLNFKGLLPNNLFGWCHFLIILLYNIKYDIKNETMETESDLIWGM